MSTTEEPRPIYEQLVEAYNTLKKENICKNQYDFSRRFLGVDRSYYSVLKARKVEGTLAVLVTLETALEAGAEGSKVHELYKNVSALRRQICKELIIKDLV